MYFGVFRRPREHQTTRANVSDKKQGRKVRDSVIKVGPTGRFNTLKTSARACEDTLTTNGLPATPKPSLRSIPLDYSSTVLTLRFDAERLNRETRLTSTAKLSG